MRHNSLYLILLLAFTVIFSCSDPALIGSELLSEDVIGLKFTDEIPIAGKTIAGGVVQTYSPFRVEALNNHLVGRINDPAFGSTEASIYTQFSLGSQTTPNFANATIDSVVMSIAYHPSVRGFGDLDQEFEVEVRAIDEGMQSIENYFSDNTLATVTPKGEEITARFIPALAEELVVNNYTGTDTIRQDTLAPHLRIRIDPIFASLDTAAFTSNSNLHENIKGLHIRTKESNQGMLNLNFINSSSRISVYYSVFKEEDIKEYQFAFTTGDSRFVNFNSNIEGSSVATAIATESDDLLYIQGMIGSNVELSFPDLSGFENIVVNKAELELAIATPSGDDGNTSIPTQLSVAGVQNGKVSLITDQQSVVGEPDTLSLGNFGGQPITEMVNGLSVTKYKVNLSAYLQKIIQKEVDNKLIISAGAEQASVTFSLAGQSFREGVFDSFLPKAGNASRAIFYGSNHSQFPLKLNLTYTRL